MVSMSVVDMGANGGVGVPTHLSQRAMLASLSVGYWRAHKMDRLASQAVCIANQADEGVAKVYKDLKPESCPEYEAAQKRARLLDATFRANTLPWGEGTKGLRVLP